MAAEDWLGVLDPHGFFDDSGDDPLLDGPARGRGRGSPPGRRELEALSVRIELRQAELAARPLEVGDLVRIRRTWDLGLVEAVEATWHDAVYHVAVEAGAFGITSGHYGRQELVPEDD